MNKVRQAISSVLVLAVLSLGLTPVAQAQTQRRTTGRGTNAQTRQLFRRLENGAERFRTSLDAALDRSRYDDTTREDNINVVVDDLIHVIDHLSDRYERRAITKADVEAVFLRASRIDTFMENNRLVARAERDWTTLRTDLNELSRTFDVAWRRDAGGDYNASPFPPADNDTYYDRSITGTYRLNAGLSENPRAEANLATRTLPARIRQRTYNDLVARLEAPDALAIDRRGDSVTIASTRAPQITFEADGRERVEGNAGGGALRSRADFVGDQLSVATYGDQVSNFTVTFDPVNDGRRLLVTRRITVENLREPVVVRSYYDRTADVAQYDVYRGGQGTTTPYPSDTVGSNNGEFVIPNGTTIVATLNGDVSTETAREGDRFTMNVRSPSQYAGATVEGTLRNVKRSGRVSGRSEVTFDFERIRTRDGRSYRFAGFVESIRGENGESVRVDNEGTVQEGDSQTDRTVQRTAIGTAVGAIIGAIAGGGKGAAIGAVLGAGGGAGSVYVQGREDLELRSGAELTIRASSPR
ncbi:MAG: YMGG-like glycine zipper-containing protein [Pyrinomonadaceae bacterium]